MANVYKSSLASSGAGGGSENYSTTEQVIGTWIDGSKLYQKVVNFGALPNATTKNVAHNISDLNRVIEMNGYARTPIGNCYPVPTVIISNNMDANVSIGISSTEIQITTKIDYSNVTECYVILKYTKTS